MSGIFRAICPSQWYEDMLRDALVRRSCANMFYLPMVTKIDLFDRPGFQDGAVRERDHRHTGVIVDQHARRCHR